MSESTPYTERSKLHSSALGGVVRAGNDLTRALLTAGLVAGPLFITLILVQAVSRPGFDLRRHPASLLTLGDLGSVQVANFVVVGLLTIAFAAGIRRTLHPGPGGTWGAWLIGAYGLGLVVAGLFRPDPSLGYPPGAPEGMPAELSTSSALHGVGFTIAFVSLTVACFVFARRAAAYRQAAWAAYSVATAVVALALSMWPSTDGASLRFFVASVLAAAWTTAIAARLRAEAPTPVEDDSHKTSGSPGKHEVGASR